MAVNRYSNLQHSTLRDLPMPEIPVQQLDALLGMYEQNEQIFDALSTAGFNYLQNSETDKALAQNITGYRNQLVDTLTSVAEQGDVSGYLEGLRAGTRHLAKMASPGGAIDALQQRYKAYKEKEKNYLEFFKDQPWIGQGLLKAEGISDIDYNPSTGTYSQINPNVSAVKHFGQKERNEFLAKMMPTIKETLLDKYEKIKYKSLEGITTIRELVEVTGIPYEKIFETLETLYPQEFIDSLIQENKARKALNPSTSDIDLRKYIIDPVTGQKKLNPNNPVIQDIHAFATGGEYRKPKTQFLTIKNEEARMAYEERLKKKRYDDAMYTTREEIISGAMPEPKKLFNFNNDGTVLVEKPASETVALVTTTGVPISAPTETVEKMPSKDAWEALNAGELQTSAMHNQIMETWGDQMEKQAKKGNYAKALQLYDTYAKNMHDYYRNQAVVIQKFDVMDEEGAELQDRARKKYVTQGGISEFDSFFVDFGKGKGTKGGYTYAEMLKDAGIDHEYVKENAVYEGKTTAASIMPNHHRILIPLPSGKMLIAYGSEMALAEQQLTAPMVSLSDPVRKGDMDRSEVTWTGDREMDTLYPNGIYSRPAQVTKSDRLLAQVESIQTQIDNTPVEEKETIAALKASYQKVKEEYVSLVNNPEQDIIEFGGYYFYDATFRDSPYGEQKLNSVPTSLDRLSELILQNK